MIRHMTTYVNMTIGPPAASLASPKASKNSSPLLSTDNSDDYGFVYSGDT